MISATAGSITSGSLLPSFVAYGTSKAAVNYVMRKLHFEHDNLSALVILAPIPVVYKYDRSNSQFHSRSVLALSIRICVSLSYLFVRSHYQYSYLSGAANSVLSHYPDLNSGSLVMKTSEVASAALVNLIDNATREKYGGSFTFWDDSRIEW